MPKQYVVLDFVREAKFGPFTSKSTAEKTRTVARALSDQNMAIGTNVKVVPADDERYQPELKAFSQQTEQDIEKIRRENVKVLGDPAKAVRRPWGVRQIKPKQYF